MLTSSKSLSNSPIVFSTTQFVAFAKNGSSILGSATSIFNGPLSSISDLTNCCAGKFFINGPPLDHPLPSVKSTSSSSSFALEKTYFRLLKKDASPTLKIFCSFFFR